LPEFKEYIVFLKKKKKCNLWVGLPRGCMSFGVGVSITLSIFCKKNCTHKLKTEKAAEKAADKVNKAADKAEKAAKDERQQYTKTFRLLVPPKRKALPFSLVALFGGVPPCLAA
jgi:hypothetical protein